VRAMWGVGLGVLVVIAAFVAVVEEFEAAAAALLVVGATFAVMGAFYPRWRSMAWPMGITLVLAVASFLAFLFFLLPGEST
jgi:hypothetical protein